MPWAFFDNSASWFLVSRWWNGKKAFRTCPVFVLSSCRSLFAFLFLPSATSLLPPFALQKWRYRMTVLVIKISITIWYIHKRLSKKRGWFLIGVLRFLINYAQLNIHTFEMRCFLIEKKSKMLILNHKVGSQSECWFLITVGSYSQNWFLIAVLIPNHNGSS